MPSKEAPVIWWLRRDLRVNDNAALAAALSTGQAVIPLFILDPVLLRSEASARVNFLFAALRSLDEELRQRGSRLLVLRGEPAETLSAFTHQVGAAMVFAEEDYSPYARRRDTAAAKRVPLTLTLGLTVHHPAAVVKADGKPYTVFTPFSKAWKALPASGKPWQAPTRLPEVKSDLFVQPLPEGAAHPDFPASEREAQRRLNEFLAGPAAAYQEDRNRLDLEGTSSLSPYLRFGLISSRAAVSAVRGKISQADPADRGGLETWLNELIWREFYQSILYHFPGVLREAFQPGMRAIRWRSAAADLAAWQAGQTGYPVVDAAMRQLTGMNWMHNRARMIAASFLVKDLLIDWREGERWFMRHLIDGDPAANNGGWQWTAGVGTDAAPYFRIFNPITQSVKFDPHGAYIRRWLPELRRVPPEFIHQPWLMDLETQRQAGFVLGRDYPYPLVDHAESKTRALQVYRLRGGA